MASSEASTVAISAITTPKLVSLGNGGDWSTEKESHQSQNLLNIVDRKCVGLDRTSSEPYTGVLTFVHRMDSITLNAVFEASFKGFLALGPFT